MRLAIRDSHTGDMIGDILAPGFSSNDGSPVSQINIDVGVDAIKCLPWHYNQFMICVDRPGLIEDIENGIRIFTVYGPNIDWRAEFVGFARAVGSSLNIFWLNATIRERYGSSSSNPKDWFTTLLCRAGSSWFAFGGTRYDLSGDFADILKIWLEVMEREGIDDNGIVNHFRTKFLEDEIDHVCGYAHPTDSYVAGIVPVSSLEVSHIICHMCGILIELQCAKNTNSVENNEGD